MDKVVYNMPFAKVDKERRIISGFATLNNLDIQKDIVTTEASIKAFKNFRGNIRELHNKIAAGKMLSFGVEKYYDKIANKVYDGVFVRAYISKGAPDTWEKVIDGTLNGFSIGGEILDSETIVDDDGSMVRVIKDYQLSELSLVDNPANPLANIMSIEKAYDLFSDIAHNIEKEMEKMVDTNETETVANATAEAVADIVADTPVETTEAVVEPPVENVEVAETVVPDTSVIHTPNTEDKSNDASVLAEALDKLTSLINERDTKTDEIFASIVSQLQELKGGVETTSAGVESVKGELAAVKSTVTEFDKRVTDVEQDTAVRKSGDLGEVVQEEKITKSIWGGRFLSADLLNN